MCSHKETYFEKSGCRINSVKDLTFLPPVAQLEEIVTNLDKLRVSRGCEFCVRLYNVNLDTVALKEVRLLHDLKAIKMEVDKEREWCCKVRSGVTQPQGTPVLETSVATTFCSMLLTKSETYFWPNIQLKTCEIKRLAVSRWVSDLIIYRIIELLNDAHPEVYVFYYNFVSDIGDVARRINEKFRDDKPKKIIFAINVGWGGGKTVVGNTVVGDDVVTGCYFAMAVYNAEDNTLIYGDSQGWPITESVVDEFKKCIYMTFGDATVREPSLCI